MKSTKPVIVKIKNTEKYWYFCSNCLREVKNAYIVPNEKGVIGAECIKEIAGTNYTKKFNVVELTSGCWRDNKPFLYDHGFISKKLFDRKTYNHFETLAKESKHNAEKNLPQLFDGSRLADAPPSKWKKFFTNDPIVKFIKKIGK